MTMQENSYEFQVRLKYQMYNSIFLTLHFATIRQTGIELPLFSQFIAKGLDDGLSPLEIINKYFAEHPEYSTPEERHSLLFRFIQYVERQIVLIDALEESAYDKLHDLNGEGSMAYFTDRARKDGKVEVVRKKLEDFRVKVVLTAHPTQFYPGFVLGIINDLTDAFDRNDLHKVRDLLEQLGQTPFYNKEKPSPFDEATSLGWYLENVFYEAIPEVVSKVFDEYGAEDLGNYRLLEVGFWPGGDRDGNPFVTTDITLKVAHRLQFILYKAYYNDVRKLKRRLTFRDILPKVEAMEESLRTALFEPEKGRRFDLEGFREQLLEVHTLLLERHNGFHAEAVRKLIFKTRIFGSHFAALDIRQDSRVLHSAFEHAFGQGAADMEDHNRYFGLNPLGELKLSDNNQINDTIEVFRTINKIQEDCGELACHRFIISNCRGAYSVLEAYAMAKNLGMTKPLNLDIVPLFETIDDLSHSAEIMSELYGLRQYRQHLEGRNNRQYIMLGFSDGTKDGGYFSANWSIYKAKERITASSRKHGIEVVFFDGRGGPPARGGGNVRKYYAAQGSCIENKEIQLTIQGQTVSSKFSSVKTAVHYLENLLTAGLESAVYDRGKTGESEDRYMEEIAARSLEAYVALKNREEFLPYLEHRSPLLYFGKTNVGSRPSKRGGSGKLTLDDLRAIPFVGSWSAMKQNVPGYYGLGIALEAFVKQYSKEELASLYASNPFFASLINNSMQSLSKTRMELTRYLAGDRDFGSLWTDINMENERTHQAISRLVGSGDWDKTLESMPSIELRESIVLPLLVIQQYALMKHEKDGGVDPVYGNLIIRTLYGIINAARNSA